jgi:hypothetical protein
MLSSLCASCAPIARVRASASCWLVVSLRCCVRERAGVLLLLLQACDLSLLALLVSTYIIHTCVCVCVYMYIYRERERERARARERERKRKRERERARASERERDLLLLEACDLLRHRCHFALLLEEQALLRKPRGTQFPCFTSTKVQILTPEKLLEGVYHREPPLVLSICTVVPVKQVNTVPAQAAVCPRPTSPHTTRTPP